MFNEIIYSNLDNPFTIVVTSEGLISENSSSISPENPIFAYGQEVELSLDVKDDIGTNLDYLDFSNAGQQKMTWPSQSNG